MIKNTYNKIKQKLSRPDSGFYIDKDITNNISVKVGRGTVYWYTEYGLDTVKDKSKKYKDKLNTVGDISIVTLLLTMLAGIGFFVYGAFKSFYIDPNAGTQLSNAILIPGFNDFVPLDAAPVVLVVLLSAAFIHELGHAILAFVSDYNVDEWGIILFAGIVPLGAYVDVPIQQIKDGDLIPSIRVLSAGIMANYIAFILTILVALISDISLTNGYLHYFGIISGVPQVASISLAEGVVFWSYFININLAIVNCLPIYYLDGGSVFELIYRDKLDITNLKSDDAIAVSSIFMLLTLSMLYTVPYLV